MAKTMARIENGVVVNMLWCADREPQTDTIIAMSDRPVGVGDTYDGVDFYRNGVKILTPLEALQAENDRLTTENAEYETALSEIETALGVTT